MKLYRLTFKLLKRERTALVTAKSKADAKKLFLRSFDGEMRDHLMSIEIKENTEAVILLD